DVIGQALEAGYARAEFIRGNGNLLHVAALPLQAGAATIGVLAVFHDASYIDFKLAELWRRAFLGVAIHTLLIVSITLLSLRWGIGRPVLKLARWLREMRAGAATEAPDLPMREEFAP